MTKYATFRKYQPFIEVIRRDLNIPADLEILITFRPFTGRAVGGFARMDGNRAIIQLNNRASHSWTVGALMHELKHVQQYVQNRLMWEWVPAERTKTGRKARNTGKWMQKWEGKLYNHYGASRNAQKNAKYQNQPWEVEAYTYENDKYRLFPGLQVQTRTLVGTSRDGTKFYKKVG